MNKKIAVIHTSLAILEPVDQEIKKTMPDAVIYNLIDQRILQDVIDHGGIYPEIVNRMCLYVRAAEAIGANLIFNACSSVGEAFDTARQVTRIPTLKIDEPMAEEVAASFHNVAVYGTVPTTLQPSGRLIENTADKMNRKIKVSAYLVEGAFKALTEEKNPQKHNEMVLTKILETYKKHDAIILAQASMTVLLSELASLSVPVFYSLRSGVLKASEIMERT